MTIYFSTNIPEMRAISMFNKVSTDIASIQQRLTTGQRINSGKDDPGGLVVREGMRVDIKNLQALQQNLQTSAEPMLETASQGMMQLLEALRGDPNDSTNNGLVGLLADGNTSFADKKTASENFLTLFNSILGGAKYNGENLLDAGSTKEFRLGTDNAGNPQTLSVTLPDLSAVSGAAATALSAITDGPSLTTAQGAVQTLITTISSELGKLGYNQQLIGSAIRSIDSQITTTTASEGVISNANMATESSRLARSELLAQNAMSSILYNRSYAAFSVNSLFG
ncbi:hypothetical protein FACS189443_4060 [Planctomycetales bacterium]|nr:hypothetical protein FACS189443_4060 [Planctomycetales bacterium]